MTDFRNHGEIFTILLFRLSLNATCLRVSTSECFLLEFWIYLFCMMFVYNTLFVILRRTREKMCRGRRWVTTRCEPPGTGHTTSVSLHNISFPPPHHYTDVTIIFFPRNLFGTLSRVSSYIDLLSFRNACSNALLIPSLFISAYFFLNHSNFCIICISNSNWYLSPLPYMHTLYRYCELLDYFMLLNSLYL